MLYDSRFIYDCSGLYERSNILLNPLSALVYLPPQLFHLPSSPNAFSRPEVSSARSWSTLRNSSLLSNTRLAGVPLSTSAIRW